jgi:hypothetical protein
VENASNGMMGKKATGNDVSGDVLKVLGQDGLRIMTQLERNWRVAHGYK